MALLSVVVPVKNEEANVQTLTRKVQEALNPWGEWELLFVDDGSTDQTTKKITEQAKLDPRVKLIRLRRNFGQAAATQAGIDAATGDLIATMDGDIQNDPADLVAMANRIGPDCDVVLGLREKRQDSMFIRKLPSRIANRIIRKVIGIPFKDFGCAIRVMKAEYAHNLRLYGEMHRFITVLLMNQGARIVQVPVQHHARQAGVSKYGLGRTGRVILDLVWVKFLSGYFTRPMHFLGGIGLSFIACAFLTLAATIGMKWYSGLWMTGNPLLHLSAMLCLVGVQFVLMGVIGEVLIRTYFESQNKAPYLIRETLNLEDVTIQTRQAA